MNRNKNYDLDDLTITFASLSKLFYPSDLTTNPYWKSDLGHFHLLYMEYVFGVFIHAMFDNNYQGKIKMPRQPKEARYQIEAEADLWVSVWKMIKKINEYFGKESIYDHPAVCLYKLAIDGALILSTAYDERVLDEQKVLVNNKELGKYSITRLVRIIQTQNHELKNLEHNPFDERKTFTYQLINDAISLAGQSDSFRKGEWKAMVRSREKLVTVLREGELSNGVTLEHRGRPRRVSKYNPFSVRATSFILHLKIFQVAPILCIHHQKTTRNTSSHLKNFSYKTTPIPSCHPSPVYLPTQPMAKHRTIKRPPLLWRTVPAAEIVAQLGISYSTLKRWRYQGLILEGIHWNYLPNTKARISYNLELLRDYMANGDGEAHSRSIERYAASLASSA